MTNLLAVPVYLDALVLDKLTPVAEAFADFSRLPYVNNQGRDANPNGPNISEEILSQPFQNQNLYLQPGVHLHWAIPAALTRGISAAGKTEFPAAPNRWLVTRFLQNEQNETRQDGWVVESDYANTQAAPDQKITYPASPGPAGQPFCYLGRKVSLADWLDEFTNNHRPTTYLERITAIGYGEPAFAAFYPNCRSVFGFWDETITHLNNASVSYEVVGWYSDSAQDYLAQWKKQNNPAPGSALSALQEANRWDISGGAQAVPEQMVCYARLVFIKPAAPGFKFANQKTQIPVAVANTSTEALSAYLGKQLAGENKSIVEDQLEALHLAPALARGSLDIGFKFLEARHTKGFQPSPAGTIWTLDPEIVSPTQQAGGANTGQEQVTLPLQLARLLDELNALQQASDEAGFEMESLRRQLFADWYKYMLSAYPPLVSPIDFPNVDEVRSFITEYDLPPIDQKAVAANALKLKVVDAQQALLAAQTKLAGSSLQLSSLAAPRYWEPNDPVVLLAGEIVRPTDRHGAQGELHSAGRLTCQAITVDGWGKMGAALAGPLAQIRSQAGALGSQTWDEQPWNPILLEWQAEFFPAQQGNNLDPEDHRYDPDFIQKNYLFADGSCDFSSAAGQKVVSAANIYSGRAILTPHAKNQLTQKLEDYLQANVLAGYYQARSLPADQRQTALLGRKIADILAWYQSANPAAGFTDPLYTAIRAYQELQTTPILAQSLGGFNQALLMRRQVLQLPIADPLGFSDYQEFTGQVNAAVGGDNRSAAQPLNDFNPIRAGALRIIRLRLMDAFGQVSDIDCSGVISSETMPLTGDQVTLFPRLSQPARLNFRWLAAQPAPDGQEEMEMNDHPATSPICGWILPNNLDGTLLIYDGQGQSLGSIDPGGTWQPAPGRATLASQQIPDPHMRKLAGYLIDECKNSKTTVPFLIQWVSALEQALENIDPENSAQQDAFALLMGRPLAVVRAMVNLEARGRPEVNQDWNVFRRDMRRTQTSPDSQGIQHLVRTTDEYTKVRFGVRIGEYHQLNDGLVGYLVEAEQGYQDNKFYAPQTPSPQDPAARDAGSGGGDGGLIIDHPDILIHRPDHPAMISQSIDDPPHLLTMLIDPRGVVHATCGIVPTKSIQIPPDQYAGALRAIEVTFLTAPILTGAGSINLSLPDEPGYQWSWVEKENGIWANESSIAPASAQAAFTTKQELREGWLKLSQNPDESPAPGKG